VIKSVELCLARGSSKGKGAKIEALCEENVWSRGLIERAHEEVVKFDS
jgi:hypothetical protein